MKIKRCTLTIFLIVLIFTSFYSCKKNDSQVDPPSVTQYSQLPADVSKVAEWYDQQVIDRNSRNVTGKNTIDWNKVIKSSMPDGSTVYALQISSAKNVMNELNINRSINNQFYAVIKAYTRDSLTGITTLKFLDLDENIIEQGVLKENGKYAAISKNQHIVSFRPPLQPAVDLPSNPMDGGGGGDGGGTGGDSGIPIGVDNSGQTIVVITAPGTSSDSYDQGPVFSFPSIPSFPSDPGSSSTGGGGNFGGGVISTGIPIVVTLDDRLKYPTLAKIVDGLYAKVKNNKELMDALKEFSHLSEDEILNDLSPGKGPQIVVVDQFSIIGIGEYKPDSGLILLSNSVASDANYFSTQYPTATEFYLTVTILHEFIHFGENTTKIFNPHQGHLDDAGFQFENKYYGGKVDFNKTNGIITYTPL